MKKISSLLTIAAALAALAGCVKEVVSQPEAATTHPAVLHASFESPAITRAGFAYNASDKTYAHFWEEGDCFAFFPKEDRPDRYRCTDPASCTFVLDKASSLEQKRADYTHNYAIYPTTCPLNLTFTMGNYDEEMVELLMMDYGMGYPISTTNPPVLQIEVPAQETYAAGDDTYGYGNIMAAQSLDDQIKFKSVMGWLKLQLTGAAPLKSVRITADETLGPVTLSGPGRISFDSDGMPCLTMETDPDLGAVRAYKTYNFGSNPVILDPKTPTVIYLALPPTEFTHGFTVRLTYADNSTTDLTTTRPITIERNKVTPMKSREGKSINATLVAGSTFCNRLKTLANGGTNVSTTTVETRVKGIAVRKGSDVTSDCIVSENGSENPVYAVFDGESGVVTLHTPAYRIFLPSMCTSLCYQMRGLTFIDWDELDGSAVTTAYDAFCFCQSLESIGDIDLPHATNVGYLFNNCTHLASIGSVSLPVATNANSMFTACSALTQVGDIILPEATHTSGLFSGCSQLASIGVLSLPKTTDVAQLFYGCTALTSFGDVSFPAATSATHLFRNCTHLTTVGDINLPNATNASYLLSGCAALTSVGNINLPKATNVSYLLGTGTAIDVYGLRLLTSDHLGTINAPLAQNASYMFRGCTALTSIPLVAGTAFTDMSYMFGYCSGLTSLGDLTLASTSVTNLAHMFESCTNLESVDISGLSGTVTSLAGMFKDCTHLGNVTFSAGLNTASATDMSELFYNCSAMTSINVGGFDTGAVTTMKNMFYNCSGISTLDVSGFNTAQVTNMTAMFRGCSGITSLDLSGFSTSQVIETEYMFDGCSSLTTLGSGTKFTCTALERCSYMFCDCSQLGNVDISEMKGSLKGASTYSYPSLEKMFYNCAAMTTIRFNNALYTDGVYSYASIFEGCTSLNHLYVKGFYLGQMGSSDNTAVRFSRTMTRVKSGCTVHYSSVPSMGTHASSYDMHSMFAYYSSPSTSSFNWTTSN